MGFEQQRPTIKSESGEDVEITLAGELLDEQEGPLKQERFQDFKDLPEGETLELDQPSIFEGVTSSKEIAGQAAKYAARMLEDDEVFGMTAGGADQRTRENVMKQLSQSPELLSKADQLLGDIKSKRISESAADAQLSATFTKLLSKAKDRYKADQLSKKIKGKM